MSSAQYVERLPRRRSHTFYVHKVVIEELEFSWLVECGSKQSKARTLLHNAYQFKALLHLPPFGRKVGVLRSTIFGGGGRGSVRMSGLAPIQSIAHPRLPNNCQYNLLRYLPPFGLNSNVKLCLLPQIDPRLGGGLGWNYIGVANGPIEMSSLHSC